MQCVGVLNLSTDICGEKNTAICYAIYIANDNVNDGWTDRRTDATAISVSRVSAMTR